MNLVYGHALHESLRTCSSVDRAPTGIWEVIGLKPVGDQDFFFVPHSRHADYHIFHNICLCYSHSAVPLWYPYKGV